MREGRGYSRLSKSQIHKKEKRIDKQLNKCLNVHVRKTRFILFKIEIDEFHNYLTVILCKIGEM